MAFFNFKERVDFADCLHPNRLSEIITSRRSGKLDISLNGCPVVLYDKLGSGGTKEVYDAMINNRRYALGICGTQDSPHRIIEKWSQVLEEPKNTQQLRGMGLHVNEMCEIVLVNINQISFPAIKMLRYEDLKVRVFDAKNNKGNNLPLVKRNTALNDQLLMEILEPTIQESKILISEGVRLGRDSFNLCLYQQKLHLYLNDLGSISMQKIRNSDIKKFIEYYAQWIVDAFINSVSDETYYKNPFINGLNHIDNTFKRRLEQAILVKLK